MKLLLAYLAGIMTLIDPCVLPVLPIVLASSLHRDRRAPVLMTALSAGVALIPLMIGADAPGKEILSPVAITILGGLISSTLLDTFLTPVLFLRYGRKSVERLAEAERARLSDASFASGTPLQTY